MAPDVPVRIGLEIEPLDTLFFRGGHPFGPATRAEGGLPQPQTLAGALRTAVLAAHGFDFLALVQARRESSGDGSVADLLEALGAPEGLTEARFRGPWLSRASDRPGAPPEVLLPTPASLFRVAESGAWVAARPLPEPGRLPGWEAPSPGRRPLWRDGEADARRPGGFLTLAGIEAFLRGRPPDAHDWVGAAELYGFDDRTGLEIDAETLTGVDGRLFSTRRLALKDRVRFYAEALVPAHAAEAFKTCLGGPFPWGGEGRYAVARVLDRPVSWPGGGAADVPALWLLATHGLFSRTSRPDRIAERDLIAVASGPAVAVSGWDVARGRPRPTRFAAPAGSVYFVTTPDPDGPEASLCDDPEDAAQGWGFALRGVWNDA